MNTQTKTPQAVTNAIYLSGLVAERDRLRADNDRLQKQVDRLTLEKITIIHRHGECTALLEKFAASISVMISCPKLRAEAERLSS